MTALFASLKFEVDRKRVQGRFLLTESSIVNHTPTLSESLAGRMEAVRLNPLARCELPNNLPSSATVDRPSSLLDNIARIGYEIGRTKRIGVQFHERIVAGGYPAASAKSEGRQPAAWFSNYLTAQVQRDVPAVARIRSLQTLPRLLTYPAAQTSTLFNLSACLHRFRSAGPRYEIRSIYLSRCSYLSKSRPGISIAKIDSSRRLSFIWVTQV